MCGSATLAIVVSRICMIVASITPSISSGRLVACSAATPGVGGAGGAAARGVGAAVAITLFEPGRNHLHILSNSTVTSLESPAINWRGLAASSATRTGTRWVTLTQFAVGVLRRQHREFGARAPRRSTRHGP